MGKDTINDKIDQFNEIYHEITLNGDEDEAYPGVIEARRRHLQPSLTHIDESLWYDNSAHTQEKHSDTAQTQSETLSNTHGDGHGDVQGDGIDVKNGDGDSRVDKLSNTYGDGHGDGNGDEDDDDGGGDCRVESEKRLEFLIDRAR